MKEVRVVLDVNGAMHDGQHALQAAAESGEAINVTVQNWQEIHEEADWVRYAINHALVYPQALTEMRYDEGEHGDTILDWVSDLVEDVISEGVEALVKDGFGEPAARQMTLDLLLIDREEIDSFIQDRAEADDEIEVVRAAADAVIEGFAFEATH